MFKSNPFKSHYSTFSYILDKLLWLLIAVIPLIMFIGKDGAFFLDFLNEFYTFTFISDIINSVLGVVGFDISAVIVAYISYLVSVEIIHCFFDVLVFIPRFAHSLIERCVE